MDDQIKFSNTKEFAAFDVHDNTLLANKDLLWENIAEFKQALKTLSASEQTELVLDLSHSGFIFSSYFGEIGSLIGDVLPEGKQIKVRVNEKMAWLFKMTGFERMIQLEVVK